MQIEVSEPTAQILAAQAAANGRSLNVYAESVLTRFARTSSNPLALAEPFEVRTHEDALASILSRNPTIATSRPEETDWQQLKGEGRRF
jgi:hypothetical protein